MIIKQDEKSDDQGERNQLPSLLSVLKRLSIGF